MTKQDIIKREIKLDNRLEIVIKAIKKAGFNIYVDGKAINLNGFISVEL